MAGKAIWKGYAYFGDIDVPDQAHRPVGVEALDRRVKDSSKSSEVCGGFRKTTEGFHNRSERFRLGLIGSTFNPPYERVTVQWEITFDQI